MIRQGAVEETRVGDIRDVGLLALRLVTGLLLAGHGAQKLFGVLGGHGLDGTARFFAGLGYEPATFFAALAGLAEFGGGLLLALGLLTPLAAAAVLGVMANAVVADWSKGLLGGFEYPLLLGTVGVVVACTGAGRYALDHGRPWERHGAAWATASIALGLLSAAGALLVRAL
ncbi:DoxX family protein [Nonomuraea sp. NPDC050310]|uniref:DoxX family protein n=1 Tax=unclassified Nonomuraea TaxID=2593643 RepID=UPI003411A600